MTAPAPTRRLTLLLSTPRTAPGLFTREAWSALEGAGTVLARDADEPQLVAIQEAGMTAAHLGELEPAVLARRLVDLAVDGEVVWVAAADGDPGLTDALAAEVSRRPDPPEVELLVGSYDVPGARLLDLVALMDRLRSPGGCPWDAEQTHQTLVPYLIEEAFELVEAIETGDRDHLAEELGDVLLQVAFHARVAEEDPDAPFDIDDVAGLLVGKLVRRHPHVFADRAGGAGDDESEGGESEGGESEGGESEGGESEGGESECEGAEGEGAEGEGAEGEGAERGGLTPDEVAVSWDQIKAAEKPHRTSILHGIPPRLPALARADAVLGRLARAGLGAAAAQAATGDDIGARMLSILLEARERGEDAEAALRATVRRLERAGGDSAAGDPGRSAGSLDPGTGGRSPSAGAGR